MDCYHLKLILYRHTARLVSSSKGHCLEFQILYRLLVLCTTLSHQFQCDTHYLTSYDTNRFKLVLNTVLATSDKTPTPKAAKTVPVRNGINPANAGKNPPSIFML